MHKWEWLTTILSPTAPLVNMSIDNTSPMFQCKKADILLYVNNLESRYPGAVFIA